MKPKLIVVLAWICVWTSPAAGQTMEQIMGTEEPKAVHSILPIDAILPYMPKDSQYVSLPVNPGGKIQFTPLANFFFRPEGTSNYKEAGMALDTGNLNFYLRGDFGARISLPKNIDLVFNLQSYGVYTRALGPLDPNMSLYEAYADMKALDRAGKLSLRFGRASLGKYGTEILVGDDDFTKGRSFETVRLRYHTQRLTSDVMWVQLYQAAPAGADFDWNHPIFLGYFNTLNFSSAVNFDANLPFIIDQYYQGWRTTVLMPHVRFFGQASNLRYSAEVILQTGSAKGILDESVEGDLNAHAAEASIGYQSDDQRLNVDVAYYRGSGDDDPTDDELKSYNVLWQNEHRRFGFVDVFKGSNVQAGTFHLDYMAGRLVSTGLHATFASVLEPTDRSPGIATIGNLNNLETDSKSIGVGGDVYLNYYHSQNLNFQFTAAVFSPGDYFTAVSGLEDLMVRGYILMCVKL